MDLLVFLNLCLLAYGGYSVFRYYKRRSSNKAAYQKLCNSPVLRNLSDEEKAALQPFLLAQKITVDNEVRALSGPFLQHGLIFQGSRTLHNTIGGVDVFLPYDALDCADTQNEAQVVMSDRCAVVIRLNDFEILDARDRAQRQQASDSQWLRERSSTLLNSAEADHEGLPMASAPDTPDVQSERYSRGEVVVLSQREETPEEVKQRLGGSYTWASLLFGLLTFVLLWMVTWEQMGDINTWLLGLGIFSCVCAVWLYVRKPNANPLASQPKSVQRVRGLLKQLTITSAQNASQKQLNLFVGDTQSVILPFHWQAAATRVLGNVVTLELRSHDFSAVSFGKQWSVTDEWRRFQPVYWGRHLLHFLLGLLAVSVLAMDPPDLRRDTALVFYAMARQPMQNFGDDLKPGIFNEQQLPSWGSGVRISGKSRCDMQPANPQQSDKLPVLDCDTFRWMANPPVLPKFTLPPSLQALQSPDFLTSQEVLFPEMNLMTLQIQLSAKLQLQNFRADRARIDAACDDPQGLPPNLCAGLRQRWLETLKSAFSIKEQTVVSDWPTLVNKTLDDQNQPKLHLSRPQIDALHQAVRQALGQVMLNKMEAAIDLIQMPSGGVRIETAKTDRTKLSGVNNAQQTGTQFSERLTRLEYNASEQGLRPFLRAGVVTHRSTDAQGIPSLYIEPSIDRSHISAAAARLIWGVLFGAWVLLQASLLFVRLRQSKHQQGRLYEDMARRKAAGDSAEA
jgi:hypothetical protein